jgi:hypothetical protein
MGDEALAQAFEAAMYEVYRRAKSEARYTPSVFFGMLTEQGGLSTARTLIHRPAVSDGYTALWERGRLDLTVEAVVIDNPRWHPLFTPEELAICRRRLEKYRYFG